MFMKDIQKGIDDADNGRVSNAFEFLDSLRNKLPKSVIADEVPQSEY